LVESRFEALRTATTALVGREEEIELLMRRWTQAKAGYGCAVLISGEPGIGKSRIAASLHERLSTEPHTRIRFFCAPHHQDSALYPAIAQLERAAGFRRENAAKQRLTKLEALLAQATNDVSGVAPLFADLLSLSTEERYRALPLTPQKRKEKTLQALAAQAEGLALRHPVLMIFEDVHWSDPTTRELLDLLIDQAPRMRLLAVITYRPEFSPPWVGLPHVTLMTLNRLPRQRRAEMISHMTGGKTLPREITDQIVERTDGVPPFNEELTKSVIESGVVANGGITIWLLWQLWRFQHRSMLRSSRASIDLRRPARWRKSGRHLVDNSRTSLSPPLRPCRKSGLALRCNNWRAPS
jgi:predicted ATPase